MISIYKLWSIVADRLNTSPLRFCIAVAIFSWLFALNIYVRNPKNSGIKIVTCSNLNNYLPNWYFYLAFSCCCKFNSITICRANIYEGHGTQRIIFSLPLKFWVIFQHRSSPEHLKFRSHLIDPIEKFQFMPQRYSHLLKNTVNYRLNLIAPSKVSIQCV